MLSAEKAIARADVLTQSTRRRTHQSGPLGELFDHGMYYPYQNRRLAKSNDQVWTLVTRYSRSFFSQRQ